MTQDITPPELQYLPTEILLLIVSGVDKDLRHTALAGLSRTNKSLHTKCNRLLYDHAIKQNYPEITTLAARDGKLETLMKAHEYGADLNAVTWVSVPSWAADFYSIIIRNRGRGSEDFGFTWASPLAMAAFEGHYHVAKYLMTLRVDVDVPCKLFCRCHVSNDILDDLLEAPRATQYTGWLDSFCRVGVWSPLHFALCRKQTSIARLLISYGASLTNTRYPIRSQFPRGNCLAALLGLYNVDKKKTLAIREQLGPLIRSLGHTGTVQNEDTGVEIDNGDSGSDASISGVSSSKIADGDWDYDAEDTGHAIHAAAVNGNETVLRRLVLDHNMDINQPTRKGATVLHYVLKTESIEMVRCVLSLGANPNAPLDGFENAAEWALFLSQSRKWQSGHLNQVMQALLDGGVSLWTQRRKGTARPGEMSMVVNQYVDWLSNWDLQSYDGWFRRFILGAIAKHDEKRHRKLKREKMDLFWSVLLDPRVHEGALNTIIDLMGPIDFAERVSEDTIPPGDGVVSTRATIGQQAFRSLRGSNLGQVRTAEWSSITGKIEWISKQGVPLSHKTLCFSHGIIKQELRAKSGSEWWSSALV